MTYPEGSVKDCRPYDGDLKEWIAAEEAWLNEQTRNFGLYGFNHETMLDTAAFPMVAAVQGKYIHGADFFGDSIFVDYGESRDPENPDQGSHHSGWRLLREVNRAEGLVFLSRSNPNTCGIEILVEGEPPSEWVEEVIRAYYTARRVAMVAQSRYPPCRCRAMG